MTRCDPSAATVARIQRGGLYPHVLTSHTGAWSCELAAEARWRMECDLGHKGAPMPLCLPHRARIAARSSGICTYCAWPPELQGVSAAMETAERQLAAVAGPARDVVQRRVDSLAGQLQDMARLGVVREVPMRLVEVS